MLILKSTSPLRWGELALPMWGLKKDWYGKSISRPCMFSLAMDADLLWFVTASSLPPVMHPAARPGAFVAELWKQDVAELFVADPESGRYFEFNLAANGAWWSCEFTAPRVRAETIDIVFPDVATYAELSIEGGWMAAMSIPLDLLQARVGFCGTALINVAFIVGSPDQHFLSASKMPGMEADFHQPQHFSQFRFHELDNS